MADAVAVLDHFGIERAWAVGHSWGGHLALHLLVAHPERLLGVVCIDPLGAFERVFAEFGANLRGAAERRRRSPGSTRSRGRRRRRGHRGRPGRAVAAGLAALVRRSRGGAADPAGRIGVACSTGTNASISDHFGLITLATGLPSARLPALFVHGERDPLPVSSSLEAAALIPGARVETIPDCGHFPWMERPGEIRKAVGRFLPGA